MQAPLSSLEANTIETEVRLLELETKRIELLQRQKELEKSNFEFIKSPLVITVITATIGLLTTLLTLSIQGCNERAAKLDESNLQNQNRQHELTLENKKFQAKLIEDVLQKSPDQFTAARSLKFLAEVGIVSEFQFKLEEFLDRAKNDPELQIPYNATLGSITGFDDSRPVSPQDTKNPPYASICYLEITNADGTRSLSTGWLAAPDLVITAGYVIWPNITKAFPREVKVYAGRSGDEFIATGQSNQFLIPREWTTQNDENFNIGAIKLRQPLSDKIAPLAFRTVTDDELRKVRLNLLGYPSEKPSGTMWLGVGLTQDVRPHFIVHSIDTSPGQGGAPLIYMPPGGEPIVVGIHTYRTHLSKIALRINTSIEEMINEWIQNTSPPQPTE